MAWVTVLPGGCDDLRFGYTLADVARLARAATSSAGAYAADYVELMETAWSGIVEALYASAHPPPEHQLLRAGQAAIWESVRSGQRAHGGSSVRAYEPGSMAAFQRFWWSYRAVVRSPEDGVVDGLAITQILPVLTPGERSAVLAMAAHHCDAAAAAAALGLARPTFKARLTAARRRVFGLWHEGESPSGVWRTAGTTRRRLAAAGVGSLGGHCRRGHAFDVENTYVRSNGKRACRRCIADAAVRLRRRRPVGGVTGRG